MINSRKKGFTNVKGFTLVELVIVIAVVAILAAVLIPTFSSLVKKANIRSDTVLAKNLNTAAIAAQADTFDEAIESVKEAGYLIANLNAKAKDCYFVWEDSTNQFLQYDLTENKVIYSNTNNYAELGSTWCFAISNPTVAQTVLDKLNVEVEIMKTAANINDFQELLNKGGTQTIYIDESVIVSSNKTIKINDDNANITLKLGKSSLATDGQIDSIPIELIKGELTVEGGFIGGSGKFENTQGTFNTAIGFDGLAKKLTLKGVTILGKGNAVAGANYTDGPVHVEIIDSKLSSDNVGFQMSDGTATLINTEIICPNPIFATFGTKITIMSGTYKSTTDCLFEMNDNTEGITEVIVKDGKFEFNKLCIFNGEAKITITGGTFNGVNYLDFFKNDTNISNIDGSVTINGSVVTIEKSNN